MADKRVKYIYDDGPFCEVGITGKQTSWRRNQSGFVTEANALLLIASGKFVLSSTDFATDQDGLDLHLSQHAAISSPIIKRFPTWPTNTGFLLASLVASSTASRTSGVVTIAATAHGITTGTSFVGYRFYYPGSPSLAAGWYDSILTIPDANTLTFSATGADFTSESINSGAAWLSNTDIVTTVLPGNTLRDGSIVTLVAARDSGVTAASKNIQLLFGGGVAGVNYASSTPKEIYRASFACVGNNKQFVTQAPSDCVFSSSLHTSAKDITADNIVTIRGSVSVAGDFLVLNHAHLEIT